MSPKRILRRSGWLLAPLLVLAFAYFWKTGVLKQEWGRASGGPPAVDCPAWIELGERKPEELVYHRFTVRNNGGQKLVIDRARSTCSCGALEKIIPGGSEPLDELRVLPGGQAELAVRLTVRTDGPGTFAQTVSFQTNDPDRPECRVILRFQTISGGPHALPNAVTFARIGVTSDVREVVDVFDRRSPPQAVARVACGHPDLVSVRWTPAAAQEPGGSGTLLGRIQVVPNTAQPLTLSTTVRVEFADPGGEPLTIPVNVHVVPRVEATPGALVLPRSTGAGFTYSAVCLVHGPGGEPPRLEVVSSPPDLAVEVMPSPDGGNPVVRVTWNPAPAGDRGVGRKQVRLRATFGGESEEIELPVTCELPK